MATYREKIPGSAAVSSTSLPTIEQIALTTSGDSGSTFPALRIDGATVTLSSTNITSILDVVVNSTVYNYAPCNPSDGSATAMMIQSTVNTVKVFDGERSGNPAGNRRGYGLPASLVASKDAISIFWVARVPSSTWTNHSGAATQTLVSYIPGWQDSGTSYLWRVRATSSTFEFAAKRAIADASFVTGQITFDTTKWHAGELVIDFAAGTAKMIIYLPDASGALVAAGTSLASGMVGSGQSQSAGGSDLVDFGYQFKSAGSAQQWYGQVADFLIYPAALTAKDRFGLVDFARRRIYVLNGGS